MRFYPYSKPESAPAKKRKQKTQGQPKDLLLHSTSHRTLDYTAREDKPKTGDSLLKHYIGVFDPQSGKLNIIEAKKMVVRGVVRSRQAEDEAMAEQTVKYVSSQWPPFRYCLRPSDIVLQNNYEMKTELGQAFGTRKAKKALLSVTENAIDPTKGTGGPKKMGEADLALMDKIKGTTANMATQDELQAVVDQARPVPKGNYTAQDIEDVYDPREIIGAEVLNAIPIRDWQEQVKKGEAVQVASRFVANRLNRVAAGEGAALRLKILRYLLWLILFWNSTTPGKQRGTKSIAKRDKLRELLAPAPEVVVENIRRKFSDNGEMRKLHMDLLFTHCCVFASIIDSYDVDTYDLKEDLRLEQKAINQYFMECGAKTRPFKKGDLIVHYAKLSLPLVFPRLRAHRQR